MNHSRQQPPTSIVPASENSGEPPIAETRMTQLEDGSCVLEMDARSEICKYLVRAKELLEEDLGPLTFSEVIHAALEEAIAELEKQGSQAE
jgi:hypothetical protein